jgi:predicted transcriptional regulator
MWGGQSCLQPPILAASSATRAHYNKAMSNTTLDLNQSIPLTDEEDSETLAAIDRGIQAANEGRTVSIDEVRKMIPNWISKFDSQSRR